MFNKEEPMTETITCKKCGGEAQHYARGKCQKCWRLRLSLIHRRL